MTNYLLWGFSKGIKSTIINKFLLGFIYFLKFFLCKIVSKVFHSVSGSIKLVGYYNYKNCEFLQFGTTGMHI